MLGMNCRWVEKDVKDRNILQENFNRDLAFFVQLIDQKFWKKIYVVTGIGGTRTDFLVSWLDLHKNFHNINSHWAISPNTGATSLGYPSFLIHHPPSNDDDSSTWARSIDDALAGRYRACGKNLVIKSHVPSKWLGPFLEKISFFQHMVLIVISTEHANEDHQRLINWEFVCKTYLDQKRLDITLQAMTDFHGIPEIDINHRNFHDLLSAFLQKEMRDGIPVVPTVPKKVPCKILDYPRLIADNGAKYVTDILELDVDPIADALWEQKFNQSFSPKEIEFFGKSYSYEYLKNFLI